jgi:hypothetical protein
MTEKTFDIEELKHKLESGKQLTRAEEIFYLMKLMNHTRKEAEYVIDITKLREKYPNITFD